jgi:pyrimidine-specific ribonucleoside hydrolase
MSATGEVWVDTDPALGLPLADVDDALALVWLAASGARVVGISTVYGNAPLDRVHPVAERLAGELGVPRVVRGAAGPGERDTPAAEALAAFDGTVLAIGPLTNVAAAIERGARWERLVVLGGACRRMPNLRPLHTTELNFALDEPAAAAVLERGCDLVPMEPCRAVRFGAAELAALPPEMARACRSWRWTSPLRTLSLSFHPWDLVAAAWVTDPELLSIRPARATLASGPLSRGYVRYVEGGGQVAHAVDGPALSARFVERVGRWRDRRGSA